jgi:hypothetical protein
MSTKLPISKVTSLVRCLCQLHNFCVDERMIRVAVSALELGQDDEEEDMAAHLDSDHANIVLAGGFAIDRDDPPDGLLHFGDHFDDCSRAVRGRASRKSGELVVLPRELMCATVENRGLRRPTPIKWHGTIPASVDT